MESMVFAWRRLTEDEARRVHVALKETPNILGYTVAELTGFSRVLTAQSATGELAGVCIVKDLLGGWSDLAVLFVLPEFRGAGIGSALFSEAFSATLARGRHVYVLSRNPSVIRRMADQGMELTRVMWRAPLAVQLHLNVHMSSRYRWREMVRKARELPRDGAGFVAGTKKSGPVGPL